VPTVAVASLLERDDFSIGGLGLGKHSKQPCEGEASDVAGKNTKGAAPDSSGGGRAKRLSAAKQGISR
jgi:hypothetical protein